MPRARHKAKGPKPTKDWREQANRMLGKRFLDLGSRHAAKQAAGLKGNASTGFIHSIATLRKHEFALKKAGEWLEQTFGVTRLDMISKEQAVAYLAHRQTEVGQKQLDADRLALQFCRKVGDLARIKTDRMETKSGRAYTPGQVARIAERQSEHNGLATRIAYNAGLRAHELKTLRPIDQGKPSAHREWRPDRFLGRTGTRYLVVGKGGLVREVLLSEALSRALEARRLDTPLPAKDRGIHYTAYYDIGGGNAWSKSFGDGSRRELGWSTGAHGVRHTYAQERLRELQGRGYTYPVAKLVLSQELGHFREDVVNTYLR